jgi:hypothetical protein
VQGVTFQFILITFYAIIIEDTREKEINEENSKTGESK